MRCACGSETMCAAPTCMHPIARAIDSGNPFHPLLWPKSPPRRFGEPLDKVRMARALWGLKEPYRLELAERFTPQERTEIWAEWLAAMLRTERLQYRSVDGLPYIGGPEFGIIGGGVEKNSAIEMPRQLYLGYEIGEIPSITMYETDRYYRQQWFAGIRTSWGRAVQIWKGSIFVHADKVDTIRGSADR